MSLRTFLKQRMTVYTVETGKDAVGGRVETETPRHSNVPCMLRLLNGRERDVNGREGVVATHRLYCAHKHAVRASDTVRVGTQVWDPVLPYDPQSLGKHWQVDVVERN